MATSKIKLYELLPDPLDPTPDRVEEYVKALQELGPSGAELAQREAWSQIRLAGARASDRPAEAQETLNRIFRIGTPPDPEPDGPYDGILVTPTTARMADGLLRGLSSAWMPWLGKRFDRSSQTGDNLLTRSAKNPSRALFRGYQLQEAGDGNYAAFKFRTYVAPGMLDPDVQALKIDYDSEENPSFLIRDILDELVQVVPGAYLGKVLLRRGEREAPNWKLLGYFALQPAAAEKVSAPKERAKKKKEPARAEQAAAS